MEADVLDAKGKNSTLRARLETPTETFICRGQGKRRSSVFARSAEGPER